MNPHRPLSNHEKDLLTQKLFDARQADPEKLREALPEVAELLDALGKPSDSPYPVSGLIGLTVREKEFHAGALGKLMSQYQKLTAAQAIEGLEHGANLLAESGSMPKPDLRDDLLKLVRKATGIRPRKTGKPEVKVLGEGNASRIVPVVRGLDLHLTWEFKLIKVSMDPSQWRLRCQAVSMVGIGQDLQGATDVAENHDSYFINAIENG